MVAQDILVVLVLVRTQVSQPEQRVASFSARLFALLLTAARDAGSAGFLSMVFPHPSGNMSILGRCEPGVDSFILFAH